ncbi:transferrin-binding protein-like solute binding protein [Amphritea balenae]|uniref:Transferrin-binding protein B C-lobe/N-lobe beta-barrel domain-containing protein n=1 Tax=Amphritea balenae TaxID=452629 RepID=A0A3P1SWD2_9GAMM|nr:transferrin-binding protein-like solute binding protein [Amphritea balenae]RRD01522.1 hypothetical protein EHS89_02905 [Amphritea balenae]GGK56314.1 hypothetical protein GCM10007941_03120 [Amphritea balenae]
MKYKNFSAILISISSSLALVACGGSGAGFAKPTLPFSSFPAIKADQTIVAEGISQAATVTLDTDTDLVIDVSPAILDSDTTEVTLGFDSVKDLNTLTVESASANLSWTESSGDTFLNSGVGLFISSDAFFISNPDSSQTFVLADPADPSLNWNYQTFGVWQDTSVSGTTITNHRGVASLGRVSPVSGIPTSGSATYTGLASGFFSDINGNPHLFDSTLSAQASFSARSISFTTSATTTINENTLNITSEPGLNLSGNLFYNSGSNQFSGSLSTANGYLDGTATGRFYGSNAEEIGGTFDLRGSASESMLGGFGAKR